MKSGGTSRIGAVAAVEWLQCRSPGLRGIANGLLAVERDAGAVAALSGARAEQRSGGAADRREPADGAPLDRLLHRCHIVNIRGNSYRMRRHAELSKAIHPLATRTDPASPTREAAS